MFPGVLLYIGGVVVGLFATDARPGTRIAVALLWPLGPLAFAVTIATLLVASVIAFPLVGVVVAALAGTAWWWWR